MPAGDGTGPVGTGAIGWGLGPCGAGLRRGPGSYPFGAWGYGGGFGRSPGPGFRRGPRPGVGRGYRWFWRQPAASWWPGYSAAAAEPAVRPMGRRSEPTAERDWLQAMAADLQEKLEQIEARLDELTGEKAEE
jgi:hypothetical protein